MSWSQLDFRYVSEGKDEGWNRRMDSERCPNRNQSDPKHSLHTKSQVVNLPEEDRKVKILQILNLKSSGPQGFETHLID
jgi:hypothetical protein